MNLFNLFENDTNHGFCTNIEKQTIDNTNYRKVLFTAKQCQLVVMSLKSKEEIGEETHDGDQFIRIDQGVGIIEINGFKHEVTDGFAVIIPGGYKHNVINTGTEDLKLYTVYTPPVHNKNVIQQNKQNTDKKFDGSTNL